jgi:hypothetical protein
MTHVDHPAPDRTNARVQRRPLATPVVLILISLTHLAYLPLIELRGIPWQPTAFAASMVLGAGYGWAALLARRGHGLRLAFSLIVCEDLVFLALASLMGYPWADYLRPGTLALLSLQLALAFAEIVRRQEAGRPIVPATRLAWFVLANALALAVWAILKPPGLGGSG